MRAATRNMCTHIRHFRGHNVHVHVHLYIWTCNYCYLKPLITILILHLHVYACTHRLYIQLQIHYIYTCRGIYMYICTCCHIGPWMYALVCDMHSQKTQSNDALPTSTVYTTIYRYMYKCIYIVHIWLHIIKYTCIGHMQWLVKLLLLYKHMCLYSIYMTLYTCIFVCAPVTAKHLKSSLWFLMDVELDMSTGTHAWGREVHMYSITCGYMSIHLSQDGCCCNLQTHVLEENCEQVIELHFKISASFLPCSIHHHTETLTTTQHPAHERRT